MPQKGLVPTKGWTIVRVSSESRSNGKLAKNAIDGDPRIHWHTRFQGGVLKHPHELVIDLGGGTRAHCGRCGHMLGLGRETFDLGP